MMRGFVSLLLLAFAACGSEAASEPAGDTFVAFARDFQKYFTWQPFVINDAGPQGATHLAGSRVEYINAFPAAGATEFPIGTIVVKEMAAAVGSAERQIFAMVKRGGAFNLQGPKGWEWFELQRAPDDVVSILWRGVGPPNGEKYGGDPTGGCNVCHGLGAANDFVLGPELKLVR
jgi:hypothetical protein